MQDGARQAVQLAACYVGYGNHPQWPGDARIALNFNLNYETCQFTHNFYFRASWGRLRAASLSRISKSNPCPQESGMSHYDATSECALDATIIELKIES